LQPNTHVISIDYRGFGYSTGSPTEAGLIADGTAIVDWVLHVANIPPERVVILGQSLGTAVASAVALEFADPLQEASLQFSPETAPLLRGSRSISTPVAFAGVILVAPFSSLPSLMLTYRLGGWIPLLMPIRPFPWLTDALLGCMTDVWPSASRLLAYYQALANSPLLESKQDDLSGDGSTTRRKMGTLQLIHAINDMDISYHQTEMICKRILGEGKACIDGSHGASTLHVRDSGRPRLQFQLVEHGGEYQQFLFSYHVLTESHRTQQDRNILASFYSCR
jgi:abhydrolase domain-containing protein 12